MINYDSDYLVGILDSGIVTAPYNDL